MKNEQKRNSAQLGLDLYNWWSRRIETFAGYTPSSKPHIERDKNKIFLELMGSEFIIGFRSSSENLGRQEFFVCPVEKEESFVSPIQRAVSEKISELKGNELKTYRRIFGHSLPRVGVETVQFKDKDYRTIYVSSQIAEIPQGKNQGLSDNLFLYFNRSILGPVQEAVLTPSRFT